MLKETTLRREYEVELAYMRGNYELASRRFSETLPGRPHPLLRLHAVFAVRHPSE